MPRPLFAACLTNEGLTAKMVKLGGELQGQVEGLFDQQYMSFMENVDEEIPYVRDYKPDSDEVLIVPADTVPGVALFRDTVEQSGTAAKELGATSLGSARVKALFIGEAKDGKERILVQRFTGAQVLDRKFMLLLQGDVYRRFTDSAFALDTSLTFVIEGGLIKFKLFDKLRAILDVKELYRRATDAEVLQFATHDSFTVPDPEHFVEAANQVTRKSIGAILSSGFLDKYTPAELKRIAATTNLDIDIEDDKIALPSDRRKLKELLSFLTEQRFIGLLSGNPFIANSLRPA